MSTFSENSMNPPSSLAAMALFGKAKIAALQVLLAEPGQSLHLRQIARDGDISPSALARELDALVEAKILLEERESNRRMFRANVNSPLFLPLRELAKAIIGDIAARPSERAERKSRKLGLSAPYDWSNSDISDDVLILKAASSLNFEDVARLCATYGVKRVRNVVDTKVKDLFSKAVLDRQLRNIDAAARSVEHAT